MPILWEKNSLCVASRMVVCRMPVGEVRLKLDDLSPESANHPRNAPTLTTSMKDPTIYLLYPQLRQLEQKQTMKLTDLNPRWVGYPGPVYDGVSFDCPHCRTQRLAIKFSPPIDPNGWWPKMTQPTYAGVNLWKRTGDTFDTLSLTPSVDASFDSHWHGFIINGQVS